MSHESNRPASNEALRFRESVRCLELAVRTWHVAKREIGGGLQDLLRAFGDVLTADAHHALIATALTGEILYWSPGAERLLGIDRGEALGSRLTEHLIAGPAGEAVSDLLARAQRLGSAELQFTARPKRGAPVELDLLMRTIPDDAGRAASIAIRATPRATASADEADDGFRALVEQAPDGMVIVASDGRIVLVNKKTEELFGYAREELLGEKVELLLPSRFRAAHEGHRDRYGADPKSRPMGSNLELFGLRKDGFEFPIEISLSPLHTERGMLVSSTIRDISARINVEAALRATNRELEAFSYSVAHDLRAPLRAIHGFSRALIDDCEEKLDADALDHLHEIQNGALRMSALIDALLSLARVSRAELRPELLDVSTIARSVIAKLAAADPTRAVDVFVQPRLEAVADPQLARALLENLLGNAWKFTAKVASPRIELGAEKQGPTRALFVRDNGAGFDMKYASKLFGAFQRMHAASEFPGTGIGLATVQRIVHRHGGKLWAEAEVGHGATFYFTLPGRIPVEHSP